MFKKCKVVLLSTNQKTAPIGIDLRGKLYNSTINLKSYHLYITSDEEINKGDWIYHPVYKTIYQWIKNADIKFDRIDAKKIIATTDNSLTNKEYTGVIDESNGVKEHWNNQLPSPSQSFIDKYISNYNKGNIITDVMVGYEVATSYNWNEGLRNKEYLKVSKDNTITIKRIKDSWNREEVVTMCFKMQHEYTEYKKSCHYGPNMREIAEWADNWIEQNL